MEYLQEKETTLMRLFKESVQCNLTVYLLTHSLNLNKPKRKEKPGGKTSTQHAAKTLTHKSMTVQTYIHVSNNLQTLVYTSAPFFLLLL